MTPSRSTKTTPYFAGKEVILCGGAINTPQVLQMSGIGCGKRLRDAGVECAVHSPGIGQHLQDHLQFDVIYKCTQPVTAWKLTTNFLPELYKWRMDSTSSMLSSTVVPIFGFHKINDTDKVPSVQHHFLPAGMENHGRSAGACTHAIADHVCTLQQLSEGEVNIRSKNPHEAPAIDPNCLSHPADLPDLVSAVKLTRDIFQQEALDAYRGDERRPGISIQSDEEIAQWLKNDGLQTCYHPVSTCRIGLDDLSPLDSEFRVKGVDNLRVVDASAMPDLISGNTNAPTIMLAGLAARSILGESELLQ